ncbi:MBL fold metallo-hydrolase [Polaribacter dokdonensis]|uniref:L-ascorbate metabolism protein UlaG, beta-lactamase superfamily n=1 Tax=Polaribacter dokdonensis DSW-5 TaxID=1300348 RepID=A0A0N0CEH8_9FLAO|nr:MBL fold metallo-hydrolase [Polaribacter dokdonensis]KOY50457.1 hypothetical protein I602_17 [Polaribacter dokdonensis DSW-5]SEE58983.1 L-ascorbate metabolism protein UlaG, beta-lactamase superfamily [Polaribacter dokdonensis DSW-5]
MKFKSISLALVAVLIISCKTEVKKTSNKKMEIAENIKEQSETEITPISHATTVLEFDDTIIYLDPTGGAEAFSDFENPDYVLITDIHGDHMNLKTLNALTLENATIIAPEAVAKEISAVKAKEVIVINNGEEKSFSNFDIEAIPMYNLREEALKFHSKGRGNGYVLTINDERIYFSGDTEDIPEMRSLENIDKAFVCMNLPYTMPVENAASGVLAFKPKQVYPYHYRGTNGLSDINKFKELVNKGDANIEVVQLNWYPNRN